MRIDAHHSCSAQYTLAYLDGILKRNRFERSILAGPPQPVPDFVAGFLVRPADLSDDPRILGALVTAAAELDALPPNLPADLDGMLAEASSLAARHPQRGLVIDHLGYPPSPAWDADLERAAACPNVYCKLSGLWRFGDPRPYVRRAMALFGPERLLFGSDWPRGLPEHTWKASLAAFTQAIGAQPMEIREQLLGGTAARVYRL